MIHPKVSVIIVSWNVAASLDKCLQSVMATTYPDLEIIVVDNNSQDTSREVLGKYKQVQLIHNWTNNGFPKAVNQGLKLSTGEYLLVLNPDCILPNSFFTQLLSSPIGGIVGPKLVDPNQIVEPSVYLQPSVYSAIQYHWFANTNFASQYAPETLTPIEVFAVEGACMFFPRVLIDKIGFLTEEVFMYYEDIDFCARAAKAGYKVIYNPNVIVIHEHGQSAKQTNQSYKYLTESFLYPLRRLLGQDSKLVSTQRYITEASIWYNGWLKHMLLTFILWSAKKFHSSTPSTS